MQNNIKKRETFSETVIDDRKFVIESFDPLLGNYILMKILTFILPMGLDSQLKNKVKGSERILNNSQRKEMSKADFIDLQRDILSTVYEKYDSGERSPVVRENGTYGIMDISAKLCLHLIIASLAFNFNDFFEDGELADIITQL